MLTVSTMGIVGGNPCGRKTAMFKNGQVHLREDLACELTSKIYFTT